jgi:branched-chain amino acid transport system permease protein
LNVRRFQWSNFIVSGSFAGLAGGLLVELNRFAQPELFHWSKSAEPLFAILIGGMNSLLGPAIGSAVLIFLRDSMLQQLHKGMLEVWAIILGLILLASVLLVPGGLMEIYDKAVKKSRKSIP